MNKINLSPEAKRRLQNERRRMSREAGKQAEREFDSAISAVRRSEAIHRQAQEHTAQVALLRNLLAVCRAVNASFGIAVPVFLEPKEVGRRDPAWTPQQWASAQYTAVGVSGRTDMTQINVSYPLWRNLGTEATPVFTTDTHHLVELISDIKALQYHELGHILFTTPVRTLLDEATNEWWAEHPEAGFPDHASARHEVFAIQRAWNILEDQRMETALVHESPYIARYLTKLVLRFMIKADWFTGPAQQHDERKEALQYFLVINRRYLPLTVRSKIRSLAVAELTEPVVAEAEGIVREYCSATTEAGLLLATLKFYWLLNRLGVTAPTMDTHPNWGKPKYDPSRSADSTQEQEQDQVTIGVSEKDSKDEGKDEGKKSKKSDETEEAKDEDTSASDGNSDGNSDDEDGDGDEDTDNGASSAESPSSDDEANGDKEEEDDSSNGAGDGASDQTKDTSVDEAIQEALDEVANELSQDSDIEETIRSINVDLNKDGTALLAPEQGKGGVVTGEALTQAEEVASRLSRSFDSAVSSAQPVWEEGHRTGVVNAFRYRTRTAGDHNYRRTLSSEGNTGLDIAVSLLLDISGSMHEHESKLSQVAYAVKTACDQVDIACTVVTFNADSRELYRREDKFVTPLALNAGGGTNPIEALRVLDTQREGEKYHLVVVLTDGHWHHTVIPYVEQQYREGRVFLGVSLGGEYLTEMGFHATASITNLDDLPEIVRGFLLNFLG